MAPLLKYVGIHSFADPHITRIWEFKINGHFFGLRVNPEGTITHYDNDLTGAKKFHVWIDQRFAPLMFDTDSFRDAYNFLVKHTVMPYFRAGCGEPVGRVTPKSEFKY